MFKTSQFNMNARRVVAAIGWSFLGALATPIGGAQATATLTPTATTAGFTLSTFVGSVPASGFCCGPIGLQNTTGGNIMIGDYGIGQIRVFGDTDGQVWTAGTPAATAYGGNNVAGLATLGGTFYAAKQASGQVVTTDAAGNELAFVASIPFATGLIGNAANNRLYVSNVSGVFAINPVGNVVTTFVNQAADGLSLNADGSILYMAINSSGHILGFNTGTSAQVFDSGFIGGGIDGTAFGTGTLAGNVFVNTNDGHLVEVNLTTLAQTVLVTGGSRGDFVTVDSNNGTLLFTQTDSVLRLTAPTGGGFGVVPEPETYAMLLAGLGLLGFMARRRKQKLG